MRGQRQSRGYRLLGITLPLAAMAIALFADLTLHRHGHGHGHCGRRQLDGARVAPPPAIDIEPESAPRALTLEDALRQLALKCSSWDAVSACLPERFALTMAGELAVFEANRPALEEIWLADLAAGDLPGPDHIAAYGLAWLRSERALPVLQRRYLADRHWESLAWGQPDDPAEVFAARQFPHHAAFAAAIEHIAQQPLRDAVKLSDVDRRRLRIDRFACVGGFAAHWVLHELDGAPLPSQRATTAWFQSCAPDALRAIGR